MVSSVALFVVLSVVTAASANVVNIPDLGIVDGTTSKSAWSGRTIYEYRGIPYAEPPTDELRFKDPVPYANWTGTIDVKEFAQACPQPDMAMMPAFNNVLQPDDEARAMQKRRAARATDIEDCLTLDVHTPTTNASAKLPVVVWFHGGSFISGSSAALRPGFLLDEKDIILVVPQYRLGPLGFFYLNTVDAPGNMGLMDQWLALKWVRDHIGAFGGDSGQVTVAGNSAGGASVSLQMLSPLFNMETDRLFNRVLSSSGAALSTWAFDVQHGEHHSRDVAMMAGCTESDPVALAECMRGKDVADLLTACLTYTAAQLQDGTLAMGASVPVLQKEAEGVVPILTRSPQDLLESGDYNPVPMMIGATKHEGIFALDVIYQGYMVPNNLVEDTLFLRTEIVPAILNAYGVDENSRVMADACTRRYFAGDELGDFTKMLPGLVDFTGVTFLKGAVFRQAELHALKARTFLYSFEYFGEHTLFKNTTSSVPVPDGLTHGDDTLYIFPRSAMPLNEHDSIIAQRMVQLFTNFIISGHPTPEGDDVKDVPEFISYHREQGAYMSIDVEARMRSMYRSKFTTARTEGMFAVMPPFDSAAPAPAAAPVVLILAAAAAFFARN